MQESSDEQGDTRPRRSQQLLRGRRAGVPPATPSNVLKDDDDDDDDEDGDKV